jgi:hypothetical protein
MPSSIFKLFQPVTLSMLYRPICGFCIPVVSTGTNDTQKVIDTHCTFMLFFAVFVYSEPRPSVPILSGRTESDPCLLTLLAPSFEGSLDRPFSVLSGRFRPGRKGLASLRSPSSVMLSTGHCSMATAHYFPNLFRINTYEISRKCCNQRTYSISKSFRCNTYEKQGGGGGVMVN